MAIADGAPAPRVSTPPRKDRLNVHTSTPQKASSKPARKRSPPRGLLARLFSLTARLFTWYAIFVVLFRCPASLDACDASSPRLCKPYFQAKAAVLPRARLYYHTYAGPYVQVVQPYYDAVDRAVLAPSWACAVRYGAPQVERARAAGHARWEATVQPQVAKAQAAAAAQYQQVLAPHVAKVQAAVGPYYDVARARALQAYRNVFLTTYDAASPYAVQGATTAAAFATNTVVPSSVWAWNRVSAFVDDTVLPRLRVVYLGTVEPQLEKIGLKLSQYSGPLQRDSRKTLTLSSFTKPAQPSTAVSAATTTTAATSTAPPATTPKPSSKLRRPEPIKPEGAAQGESEERRTARETVAEDLRAWQEKYAKAADEGAAEMEASIEAIARRMIRRNARTTGQELVDALQETIAANLAQLRGDIQAIVAAVRDGATTPADGEAQALAAARTAGRGIKERAQAVRAWRSAFTQELQATVSRAAENHFQILASIRDLALQKIGMKWAWMDGVTYKDWAKYHQLKTRFDEWEKDLEQLIVSHPALQDAETVSHALEDEGMALVETAVAELLRLREVAAWKIAAGDASNDFASDSTKAAAEAKAAADAQAAADAEAAAAEAAAAEAAAAEVATGGEASADADVADDDITAFAAPPAAATGTDTVETVAVSEVEAADPVTAEAAAATEALADTTTATRSTEAADPAAATLSPEEATALVADAADDEDEVLLTAAASGAPATAMGTTQPEGEEEHEPAQAAANAAHLPVDEVVAADEVPLDLASGEDYDEDEKPETRTRTRTTTTTAVATETVTGNAAAAAAEL